MSTIFYSLFVSFFITIIPAYILYINSSTNQIYKDVLRIIIYGTIAGTIFGLFTNGNILFIILGIVISLIILVLSTIKDVFT